MKTTRRSPSWIKLIVDKKTMWVFASSRIPKSVKRLVNYAGIYLMKSNRLERKPYLHRGYVNK